MAYRVRITKLGGRYLVFEVRDVAALRRTHGICAVFVGTTPQNPNQNVFSGLPLELLAEEAALLVDKGAAFVVDDAAAHLGQLASEDPAARHAYLQSLRTRRRLFQKVAEEEMGERRRIGEAKRAQSLAKAQAKHAAALQGKDSAVRDVDSGFLANDEDSAVDVSLFAPESPKTNPQPARAAIPPMQHITPTTSLDMLADPTANTVAVEAPPSYPLFKHLNSRGYYITPGIRFGADYSVYPGDPFRYHAHFMATSYGWDEEISVLDLVTGGRLGTGVKKGFMIGGAPPKKEPEQGQPGDTVRAFTIEWAAM
ncbi:unnamed protein product [Discula destructiva]